MEINNCCHFIIMSKVVIVGSGFSSLSAACYIAKAGHDVLVLEKNEQLGGRASMWEKDGYRFDMGPSWYWMPDVFERFFSDFGKKVSDYYELEKLAPAYRVVFGKDDFVDVGSDPLQIAEVFENIEKGSGNKLLKFLDNCKKNYEIAMQDLVYQPGLSLMEIVTPKTATRLPLFFTTISQQIRSQISNPKLRSILEFPVLFLGAKPNNTPAFYNFMNYADFGLGTWYPKGGFNSVALGMVKLANELGVEFQTNTNVTGFESDDGKVIAVKTAENLYPSDVVISGADYAHTEKLLGENKNYTEQSWKKKTFAPSSILFYVAFDRKVKNLHHHNLFFDTDFEEHAKEIYDTKVFPKAPLFYANFSSKTDDSLCPEGKEIGFFLIPVAVDLNDNEEIHEKYFEIIMRRVEDCTGENLRDAVVFKRSFGVNDFKERYNSCRGNAYGLANTLLQTSVLRPSIRNKKLKNFFYTGQLTVPGPGVPPALISGKVVSEYIINKLIING